MPWPQSQDYNEAVQNPASSFADAELRGGQAVANALGVPMPRSGNFADVYEFQGASGARWAVKCFTREVPGLQQRYEEISKFLSQARLPFTVEFQYLDQGVRIRGQWYPVLKMQWVSGFLLNEFVRNNLDKPHLLEKLVHIWLRMGKRLHDARMAHADLQHGNVILVTASRASALAVKLIDYDGMFVPGLASKKSGEVGHPAYQHPERLQHGIYSAAVDRLPLLAIACGLRALTVAGQQLWERHDNSDNLLFREADLRQPGASALFRELWNIPDDAAHDMVGHLTLGLAGPLGQVPLLHELAHENGGVKPLTAAQEDSVTAVLGPGARVTRAAVPAVSPGTAARPAGSVAANNPWETLAADAPSAKSRSAGRSILPWAIAAGIILGGVGGGLLLTGKKDSEPDKPGVGITHADPDKTKRPPLTSKPPVEKSPDENIKAAENPPPKRKKVFRPKLPAENVVKVSNSAPLDDLDPADIAAQDRHKELPETVGVLKGYPEQVWNLALSADDRFVAATGSDRRTISLWDLRQPSKHLPMVGSSTGPVAFSPDGKKLAVLTGGRVQFWEVPFGNLPAFDVPAAGTTVVAYSPDGTLLALAGKSMVRLFELIGTRFRERPLLSAPADIRTLAFSKSGAILACGSADGTVQIWDVKETPPKTERVEAEAGCYSVAIAPAGKMLAAGCARGIVQVWELDGDMVWKKRWAMQGHTQRVSSVCFAPDGKTLVSTEGGSRSLGSLKTVWWKSTGAKIKTWALPERCGTCIFSSSGRYLALGCFDRKVYILKLPREQALIARPEPKEKPKAPDAGKEIPVVLNLASSKWENLVSRLDANKLPGRWRLLSKTLISDAGRKSPPLEIPFLVFPDEYDIKATVERINGNNELYLLLLLGGNSFKVVLDRNGLTGVELLDGKALYAPARRPLFKPAEAMEVELAVRKKGLTIKADGTSVFFVGWSARFVPSVPGKRDVIGLGTAQTIMRISDLEILPLDKKPTEIIVKLPLAKQSSAVKILKPADDVIMKAEKRIRQEHTKQFAAADEETRLDLAKTLFEEGLAATNPERSYACLRQAGSVAADIGAFSLLLEAVSALETRFDVERGSLLAGAVQDAARAADKKSIAVGLLRLLNSFKNADDFGTALRLKQIKIASGYPVVDGLLKERFTVLDLCQKEHEKIKDALARLKSNPQDRAASLAVGRYLCFCKEDWNAGLPLLRQGEDTYLAELGLKELAGPKEAKDQLEVGDLWWQFAAREKSSERLSENIKRHARQWYARALPNLPDSAQNDVAARARLKWGPRSLKFGLEGQYFLKDADGQTKARPDRLEYSLNLPAKFAPVVDGIATERFSAVWQGYLAAPQAGYYRLATTTEGGCKVYLDGAPVLDAWNEKGRHAVTVLLTGRPQKLHIDYRSKDMNDSMVLSWSLIGGFPEQPVPPEALYH